MKWNILANLIHDDDEVLTEVGRECKQLAIRMADNEGSIMTEHDKEVFDSSWMALWNDKKDLQE